MNPMKTEDGYLYILTRRPSVPRKLFVHRAVLMAFIGPCPVNCEAMHTPDSSPENNKLENLKWGTRIEQRADEISRGLKIGEKSGTHKLTENDVLEIRRLRPFSTARDLAEKYGVSHTTILAAVNGDHWRHL